MTALNCYRPHILQDIKENSESVRTSHTDYFRPFVKRNDLSASNNPSSEVDFALLAAKVAMESEKTMQHQQILEEAECVQESSSDIEPNCISVRSE